MLDDSRSRITVKAATIAGFALILGVWLYVGYSVTRQLDSAQRQIADSSVRYTQAQDRFATVRLQVLLASTQVREALLDPAPDVDGYTRQLEALYQSVDRALNLYAPVLDSVAERDRVGRLRYEVDAFRSEASQVLRTDQRRWNTEARQLLRRLVPRREAAIRVADEVQARNRAAFIEQQTQMAATHNRIQRRVWAQLGAALSGSLVIAIFASLYAGRLETRLRDQRSIAKQNAADLHRFSAILIEAQEQERRRIARELDDEIGQLLVEVKVDVASVMQRSADPADQHTLQDVVGNADRALQGVRDLSNLLHPAALDALGLAGAVASYIREFSRRSGVIVDFQQSGLDERMSRESEIAVYRIVQEALTNVARHAHAQTCDVEVKRASERLVVMVSDDGVGFDMKEVHGGRQGLGLVSLRERVLQLHGTTRILSAPGEGTQLRAEWPIVKYPDSA
jgi:signal transduction histidine kinase